MIITYPFSTQTLLERQKEIITLTKNKSNKKAKETYKKLKSKRKKK